MITERIVHHNINYVFSVGKLLRTLTVTHIEHSHELYEFITTIIETAEELSSIYYKIQKADSDVVKHLLLNEYLSKLDRVIEIEEIVSCWYIN